MRRDIQKRDVEERNCLRTGADIEEQMMGTEEEIRTQRQEIRANQKDLHIRQK